KKLTQYGQATEAMSMFYQMSATGKVSAVQKAAQRALQAQLNLFSKEYRDYAKKRIDDAAELDNRERTAAEKTLIETDTNFRERSAAVKRWEAQLQQEAAKRAEREARIAELEAKKQAAAEAAAEKRRAEEEKHRRIAKLFNEAEMKARQRELQPMLDLEKELSDIGFTQNEIDYISGIYTNAENARKYAMRFVNEDGTIERSVLDKSVRRYTGEPAQAESVAAGSESVVFKPESVSDEPEIVIDNTELTAADEELGVLRNAQLNSDLKIKSLKKMLNDYRRRIDNDISSYLKLKQGGGDAEDLKTHVDSVYDELGIEHIQSADFEYYKELLKMIEDMDDVSELKDVIKRSSKMRHTAKNEKAIDRRLDKMFSDIERNNRSEMEWRQKYLEEHPDYRFDDKTPNGRDYLKSGLEMMKDIATQQVFGALADLEKSTFADKAHKSMFIAQLLNFRTIEKNVLSNYLFNMLDATANNVGWVLEWIVSDFTGFTGQRSIAMENPFSGWRKGFERANMAT
ncbi:MAG: hypothetical protein ACI38A_06930, partial [Candidatus Ornithomonoglobus sp.]